MCKVPYFFLNGRSLEEAISTDILLWFPTIKSIHPSMRDEPSSVIKTYNIHVRKLILKDISFKILF